MLKRIFSYLFVILLCFQNVAYAESTSISAASYIVLDSVSGVVLAEKNAHTPRAMASTTKIMTCLLACESGKLDDIVTITDEMLAGTIGTLIYLKPGDKITLSDLIKGALLASGNDAANAIACHLSGSVDAFIDTMNNKAKEIGLTDTVFVTPSGLDKKNHHSTAYDMALLASYALDNKIFVGICSQKSADIYISGKQQTIYNHNKLLSRDENYIGVKTGYTDKAGRCLVSAYNYSGNRIITVTMNAPDDWNDHKILVDSCKGIYQEKTFEDKFEISVVGSDTNSVMCTAQYTTSAIGEITTKAYYYPIIYAPVSVGDVVGKENIYSNNKLIMTVDIIVRKDIPIWQTMT